MASDGGGKIRNKRQFEANKPYNRRKSLIGRVGETVKDMLSPSWLVDLVSSVKKKTPPQSPNINEEQIDDHHFPSDGEVPVRREINRVREESSENSLGNSFMASVRTPSPYNHPVGSERTGYPQMPFHGFKPMQEGMVNGDDHPGGNQYTMMHHPERKDYERDFHVNESKPHQYQIDNPGPVSNTPDSTPDINKSLLTSEGSFLWSSSIKPQTPRSEPQPAAKKQTPSFNLSAFTISSLPKERSSAFGSAYLESPYYPGKTTYGGASAHRRTRLQSTAPYQQSSARKEVKAKRLSSTDVGGVTSSTARKILDSLEKMSTPLSDAKKIPSSYKSLDLDSPLSFTPSLSRRRKFGNNSRSSLEGPLSRGPPVAQINTPIIARHAPNRSSVGASSVQGPHQTSPVNEKQEPVESLKDVLSSAPSRPSREESCGRTGKMKREKGSHYSSKRSEEDVEVQAPDLSTKFTLPVRKMPNIDFGMTPVNSNVPVSNSANLIHKNSGAENGVSQTYMFSSPIQKSQPETTGNISPVNYQFSAPLHVSDEKDTEKSGSDGAPAFRFEISSPNRDLKRKPLGTYNAGEKSTVVSESKSGVPLANELKQGSVMDILGKLREPVPEPSGFGIKAATELKKGSVMDILGKGHLENKVAASGNLSSLMKKTIGWECSTCLVPNKSTSNICVACGSSKPASSLPKTDKSPDVAASSSLSQMLKKPSGMWDCPTCLVQNKPEATKCPACETPKPTKTNTEASVPSGLFQKSKGVWDCPTCLVQNKLDVDMCPACETAKPRSSNGPQSQASGPSLASKFNQSGMWECPSCLIRINPDVIKCPACETPYPKSSESSNKEPTQSSLPSLALQFKTPSGSWECDTCMVVNKAEANRCVACETPKPGAKPSTGFTSSGGFKFAAGGGFKFEPASDSKSTVSTSGDKTSSNSLTGGFQFTVPSSSENKPSKTTEIGGFKFTAPSSGTSVTTGGFTFGTDTKKSDSDKKDDSTKVTPVQFKFGDKTSETDKAPAVGGFQVGKLESENQTFTNLNQVQDNACTDKNNTGGFSFGIKPLAADAKNKDEPPKPALSGFSFNASSSVEKKSTDNTPKSTVASFGGFDQSAVLMAKDSTVPVSGFSFGSELSSNDKTPASTALTINDSGKPAQGGFSFGQTDSKAKSVSSSLGLSSNQGLLTTTTTQATDSSTGGYTLDTSSSIAGNSLNETPSGTFTFEAKSDKPALAGGFTFGKGPVTVANVGNTEGPKSDVPPASGATSGLFNFSASKQDAAPAPGFGGFGLKPAETTGDSKTPVFQFGQNAASSSSTSSTTSTSLFSFGNKSSGASSGFPLGTGFGTPAKREREDNEGPGDAKKPFGRNTGSSSNFSFGSASGSTAPEPSSGGFNFGQAIRTSTATATVPSFNFNSAQSNNTSAGNTFTFGQNANTTPAFGATSSVTTSATGPTYSSTPSFNFGGSTGGPTQSGLFQFSANSQNNANPPSGNVPSTFSFGQSNPPTQPAAPAPAANTGFNFSNSTAPNFNFGGQPTGAAASFQFSASGGAPSGPAALGNNPFNATAGTPARRNIKKAVRRRK